MEIIDVGAEEYGVLVGHEIPFYCRKEFLEFNSDKVDAVHYLVGKDTKNRFALAIGSKGNEWRAPFSAPFSEIITLRSRTTVEQAWDYISALNDYMRKHGAQSVSLYLPATVYDSQSSARFMNALLGNGYTIQYQDINFSFDLNSIDLEKYVDTLEPSARRKLKSALESGPEIHICESMDEKAEVYDIIKINREYRGFPLRMSRDQLLETIALVDHGFYMVKIHGRAVAAAVVYHLTDKIAQVVYWGNLPETEQYKPINYLAYRLIEYYKKRGFSMLDIGISTEDGEPNFGLCSFKDSIGCISSSKFRYRAQF